MNSSDFRRTARENLAGKWKKAVIISLASLVISLVISFIEKNIPENLSGLISLILLIIELPLSFGLVSAFVKLYNKYLDVAVIKIRSNKRLHVFKFGSGDKVKLYNKEDVHAFDFLSLGFSNFGKAWSISLNVLLKLLLPIIMLIISAVLLVVGGVGTFVTNSVAQTSTTVIQSMSGIAVVGFVLYFFSIIWLIVKSYYYQIAYIIAADDESLTAKDAVERSKEIMTNNRGKLFVLQLSFIGWAILTIFTLGIGYLWLAPYMQFALIAFYKHFSGKDTDTVAIENENNK